MAVKSNHGDGAIVAAIREARGVVSAEHAAILRALADGDRTNQARFDGLGEVISALQLALRMAQHLPGYLR